MLNTIKCHISTISANQVRPDNLSFDSFVDMNSNAWHIEHEAGHTLNLAAFGCFFHLIGAFDELVIRGGNAYSERLAESNSSGTGGNNIAMWA